MKKRIRDRISAARRHGRGTTSGTTSGTLTPGARAVTLCAVCSLPEAQRRRIDRELIEETVSLGAIATRIGCSKSSVKRHVDRHVKPAVTAEIRRIENKQEVAPEATPAETPRRAGETPDIRKGVRPVVERLYERCAEWADRAQDDASWPMFVACVREARQAAELVARLNGELSQGGVSNGDSQTFVLVPIAVPLPAPIPSLPQPAQDVEWSEVPDGEKEVL